MTKYLDERFLEEDFELKGTRPTELKQALTEISENTFTEEVWPACFTVFSVLNSKVRTDGSIEVAKLDPRFMNSKLIFPVEGESAYFAKGKGNKGVLPIATLKKWGLTDAIVKEVLEVGFFLQYHGEGDSIITMVPSKSFLATFCRQLGIGKLLPGVNVFRDIYIASLLRGAKDFKIVYRTNGSLAKVFGCFSDLFTHNPQTIALEFRKCLEKAGKCSVKSWSFSHSITTVDFVYDNDKQTVGNVDIIPGTRLVLSDIGDASYTLLDIAVVEGGVIELSNKTIRQHRTTLDVKELTEAYLEARLDYNVIFEKLRAKDNETVVLKKALMDIIKELKIKKILGPYRYEEFTRDYLDAIPEDVDGTQLNVITWLLKLPSLYGDSITTFRYADLSKALGGLLK